MFYNCIEAFGIDLHKAPVVQLRNIVFPDDIIKPLIAYGIPAERLFERDINRRPGFLRFEDFVCLPFGQVGSAFVQHLLYAPAFGDLMDTALGEVAVAGDLFQGTKLLYPFYRTFETGPVRLGMVEHGFDAGTAHKGEAEIPILYTVCLHTPSRAAASATFIYSRPAGTTAGSGMTGLGLHDADMASGFFCPAPLRFR